jgi:transcription elongation factor SPT5
LFVISSQVREYGQGLVERRTYRGIAYEFYGGNRYKHGHLYKLIPVASLIIDDVQPSASEIEQFERKLGAGGVEGEDAEMRDVGGSDDPLQAIAKQAQRSGEVTFTPGTLVRVVAGDLINLIGVVTGVVGSVVQVTPTGAGSGALAGPLDFQANELRKFFKVGDHVYAVLAKLGIECHISFILMCFAARLWRPPISTAMRRV